MGMAIVLIAANASCGSAVDQADEHGAPAVMAAHQIANLPAGIRSAAYDPSRNSLWILSRYFHQAGAPLLSLTIFNLGDSTASTTPIDLSAEGFIRGSVAVDGNGLVWMSWGRLLVRYTPASQSIRSWQLPEMSHVAMSPDDPALDGNSVAIAVARSGGVWLAANSVRGLFHFDPIKEVWDKVIGLPLAPTTLTQIAEPRSGFVLVNGVAAPDSSPALASVDPTTGRAHTYSARARSFAIRSASTAVYVDDRGAVSILDMTTSASLGLVGSAPISGFPNLTVDSVGNTWFSLHGYRLVGVGRINADTGVVVSFPFPQAPGGPTAGPALSCPGAPCNVANAVFDPQLQAIIVDASDNIWVVTGVAGTGGEASARTSAAPVYEVVSRA
jgi:hypothetical protein